MPLIDERGRLFGRINLIDALIIVVVLVLIPIGYTGFILFRTPAPRVLAIEPAQVPLGSEMRVKVKGAALRSLFRANIGDRPASAYLFENETSADVLFSNVPPGQYDLTLFDGVQEVARIKNGVTVLPPEAPPTSRVRMTGALIGLDETRARQFTRGQRFPESGTPVTEILAVGKPLSDERWIKTVDTNIALPLDRLFRLPVLLRTECQLVSTDCRIGGIAVGTDATVLVPGTNGEVRITVRSVRPDTDARPADVVLRVVSDPRLAALIKVGDSDDRTGVDPAAATVAAILSMQTVTGERAVRLGETSADGFVEARTTDRFTSSELLLHMGVDSAGEGWRYRGQAVRVGTAMVFGTSDYSLRGVVQSVTFPAPRRAATTKPTN